MGCNDRKEKAASGPEGPWGLRPGGKWECGMKVTASVKVLLVDDEHEFVAILTQRLTKRNYSVTFSHSGKDAYAKLEEDKE
jgi:PleD family two-component response regulator